MFEPKKLISMDTLDRVSRNLNILENYMVENRDTLTTEERNAMTSLLVIVADWIADNVKPVSERAICLASEALSLRRETALDEIATEKLWQRLPPRYTITLILTEHHGFKDVELSLFHNKPLPKGDVAKLVVLNPNRELDDLLHSYVPSQIEDTFTKAEVKEINQHFMSDSEAWGVRKIQVRRSPAPVRRGIGLGAFPVGGSTDFLMLSEVPGYSLPYSVWGFYDLRTAASREKANAQAKE